MEKWHRGGRKDLCKGMEVKIRWLRQALHALMDGVPSWKAQAWESERNQAAEQGEDTNHCSLRLHFPPATFSREFRRLD